MQILLVDNSIMKQGRALTSTTFTNSLVSYSITFLSRIGIGFKCGVKRGGFLIGEQEPLQLYPEIRMLSADGYIVERVLVHTADVRPPLVAKGISSSSISIMQNLGAAQW